MSDQHDDERERVSMAQWVTLFVVFLVLYVFSYGPVLWLQYQIGEDTTNMIRQIFYIPVVVVFEVLERPQWFIDYIAWWVE